MIDWDEIRTWQENHRAHVNALKHEMQWAAGKQADEASEHPVDRNARYLASQNEHLSSPDIMEFAASSILEIEDSIRELDPRIVALVVNYLARKALP